MISLKIQDNMLLTTISDMGEGISDQKIPSLYRALGELDEMQSNRRLKDNSIGLGISSSKIIAQNNGGDLMIIPKRYRNANYAT